MSTTFALILGIVIGLCLGVFLMGVLISSRSAEDDAKLRRAEATIDEALTEIEGFDDAVEAQVLCGFPDRLRLYKSLVTSLQKTLLRHSTNG